MFCLWGRTQRRLFHILEVIMATQAELAQSLVDLKNQMVKVKNEIDTKIQALTDALNNAGATTPEVDAALADLKSTLQSLDDETPDA